MRIASLVPSATELLFELGLGDDVVAVTHECDHPPRARELPRLTDSVIPEGLPAAEIDAAVRELAGRGESLYGLDETALAELRPDLIVTQALCAVCAVSYDDVRAVASRIPSTPEVISLDPETLGEVLDDAVRLAEATGERSRGERLRAELARRVERVREATADLPRPRVAALEWLDPPYAGGHWVPEMIELAGGSDVLGRVGEKSAVVTWEQVAEARPDVVVVMPCGLYVDEATSQAQDHADRLRELGGERVIAVDAASSFSRPGPRLVDGIEMLAHALHPGAVPATDAVAWRQITLRTPSASSHAAFGAEAPHARKWESTAPSTRSR